MDKDLFPEISPLYQIRDDRYINIMNDGKIYFTEFSWCGIGSADLDALEKVISAFKDNADLVLVGEDGELQGIRITNGQIKQMKVKMKLEEY